MIVTATATVITAQMMAMLPAIPNAAPGLRMSEK
jgi:hypothetical protein